jgi:drug/metabolite transporter (DMT)-like permease
MGEWTGLTLVLAGAVSHGLSYTLGKKGVAAADVVTFSLFRSGAGTALLLIACVPLGYHLEYFQSLPLNYLGLCFLSATLNFWTMLSFFWSLRLGRLSLMAPLHMSYPLFVFIFGSLFLSETVTPALFFGSMSILGGIAIISIAQDAGDFKTYSARNLLACLLAPFSSSLSWGSTLVIDKTLLEHMPVVALNLVKIGVPALGFFLIHLANGPVAKLKGEEQAHAVVSGIWSGDRQPALFQRAQIQPIRLGGPLSGTSMLFSVLFAIVLLGERPKGITLLAAVFVFGGVFIISLK